MPSAKILEQKKQVVSDLAERLKSAAAGVLIDYKGISVAQDTELRNEFRKAGVEYNVVKNTLARFAANQIGLDGLDDILNGTTALATSTADPVSPAKVFAAFQKKYDKLDISVKAGFVDGKVISADGVKALAELPPKEVLVARVLGGLNAPISGLANVLIGNVRGLAIALNAVAEKKQAAGE